MADLPKIIIPVDGAERPLEADLYNADAQGADVENIAATGHLNIGTIIDYDALTERRNGGGIAAHAGHSGENQLPEETAPPAPVDPGHDAQADGNFSSYSQNNSSYSNPGFTFDNSGHPATAALATSSVAAASAPSSANDQVGSVNGTDGQNGQNGTSTTFSTTESDGDNTYNTTTTNNTTNNYNYTDNYYTHTGHDGVTVDVNIDINVDAGAGGSGPSLLEVVNNITNDVNQTVNHTIDNVLDGLTGDGGITIDLGDVTTTVDSLLQPVADLTAPILTNINESLLQPVVDEVNGVVGGVPVLGDITQNVTGGLTQLLDNPTDLQGTLTDIQNILSPVTVDVQDVLGSITLPGIDLPALPDVFGTAENMVTEITQNPADILATVQNTTESLLQPVIDSVETTLGDLNLPVGDLPALPDLLGTAENMVTEITQNPADILATVQNTTESLLQPVIDSVETTLGDLNMPVGDLAALPDILSPATDVVQDVLGGLGQDPGSLPDSVSSLLAPVTDPIIDALYAPDIDAIVSDPTQLFPQLDSFMSGVSEEAPPPLNDILAQINTLLGDSPQPVDLELAQLTGNLSGDDNTLIDVNAAPLTGLFSSAGGDTNPLGLDVPLIATGDNHTGVDNSNLLDLDAPVFASGLSSAGQDNDLIDLNILTPGSNLTSTVAENNDFIHVDASILPAANALLGGSGENDALVVGLDSQLGIQPISIDIPMPELLNTASPVLSILTEQAPPIDITPLQAAVDATINTIATSTPILTDTSHNLTSAVDTTLAILTTPAAGGTAIDAGHLLSTADSNAGAATQTDTATAAAALPTPVVAPIVQHLGGLLGLHH